MWKCSESNKIGDEYTTFINRNVVIYVVEPDTLIYNIPITDRPKGKLETQNSIEK
jgi:hypothetical protein